MSNLSNSISELKDEGFSLKGVVGGCLVGITTLRPSWLPSLGFGD
jgi:hypothetical protein